VVALRDGAEALDAAKVRKWADRLDENPAVILLDKKLPKLDGHEVLKVVPRERASAAHSGGHAASSREEKDLLRSYDLGVNAYVVKPVGWTTSWMRSTTSASSGTVLNDHPRLRADRRAGAH
jgi:CheY-like chemotaxis protein